MTALAKKLLTVGHPAPFLCLDVGATKIGVALSGSTYDIVFPLPTIPFGYRNPTTVFLDLQKTLRLHKVFGVVVGLPVEESDHLARQSSKVITFIEQLTKLGSLDGVDFYFWDESWSSHDARVKMFSENVWSLGKQKRLEDQVAAMIILNGFLQTLTRSLAEIKNPKEL